MSDSSNTTTAAGTGPKGGVKNTARGWPWWVHPLGYFAVALAAYFLLFDTASAGQTGEGEADTHESVVQGVFLMGLFLWFVGASWVYLRPRRRVAAELCEARRKLPPEGGAADQPVFQSDADLLPLWEAFLKARGVKSQDQASANPDSPSSVSVADFFTMKSVLGARGSKLPAVLPGIFAAIGLLGTFVGIAMGLAGIDLVSAASEQRLEAIGQLMSGMSTAFLTSIAGISQSVWWRLAYRRADHALETSLDRFHDRVRVGFPVEEPHETLIRIADSHPVLKGLEETAKGIKVALQQLGQDLEGHLQRHVAEPLRQLNTEFGERQQQALRDMVESFQATLVASVGERLNAFGRALDAATDHQVKAARKLGRFFDRLDEVADTQTRLLERTSQIAEVFEAGLTRLTEAKDAIAEAGAVAQRTMASARELCQECQRQLEAQKQASEAAAQSWREQVEATNHLHSELRRLTTDLAGKVEEFRAVSAERLAQVFQFFDSEMARVTDHLSGTMSELREYTENLVAAVRPLPDTVTGLRDTTGELKSTTEQLTRASDAHAASFSAGIADLKAMHAEVVARMKRGLSEVREASEHLRALTAATQAGQQELASVSEDVCTRLEAVSAAAEASRERIVGKITEALKSAGDASGRVKTAIEEAVDQLRALGTRISAGTSALGDAANGAKSLVTHIKDLEERTSTASDALNTASSAAAELASNIKKMGKQLARRGDTGPAETEGEGDLEDLADATDGLAGTLDKLVDLVEGLSGRGDSGAPTTPSIAEESAGPTIKPAPGGASEGGSESISSEQSAATHRVRVGSGHSVDADRRSESDSGSNAPTEPNRPSGMSGTAEVPGEEQEAGRDKSKDKQNTESDGTTGRGRGGFLRRVLRLGRTQ